MTILCRSEVQVDDDGSLTDKQLNRLTDWLEDRLCDFEHQLACDLDDYAASEGIARDKLTVKVQL